MGFVKLAFSALCAIALAASPSVPASAASDPLADARIDLMSGDFRSASEKASKAVMASDSPSARLLAIEAMRGMADFQGASRAFDEAIAKFPDSMEIYAKAATFAVSRLDGAKAGSIYAKAVDRLCASPSVYVAARSQAYSLIDEAAAFAGRDGRETDEAALRVKAASALFSVSAPLFEATVDYLVDTARFSEAEALVERASASGAARELTASCAITICGRAIRAGRDKERYVEKMQTVCETAIGSSTVFDRRVKLLSAYGSFLKENGLLENKITSLAEAVDRAPADFEKAFLLAGLLMGSYGDARRDRYVEAFASSKGFDSRVLAAKLCRSHGKHFKAMKILQVAYRPDLSPAEETALDREMAALLAGVYYNDIRFLVFKNAVVSTFESACRDFLAGAAGTLNSRRFFRHSIDSVRTALRQALSRKGAIYYYLKLLEPSSASKERDLILSELAALYVAVSDRREAHSVNRRLFDEYPASPFAPAAVKSMIVFRQGELSGAELGREAASLLGEVVKKRGQRALSAFHDAVESAVSYDAGTQARPADHDAYLEKLLEFFGTLVKADPEDKFARARYFAIVDRLGWQFDKKMEIIDGFLRDNPCDLSILSRKEGLIIAMASNASTANPEFYRGMLRNFYSEKYMLSQVYLSRYIETLTRRNEIDKLISDLLAELGGASAAPPCRIRLLAESLFFVSRFEEAEKWYERLTAVAPSDSRSLLRLANLRKSFGKIDAAVDALKKAIESEPSERRHYVALGDLLAGAGRWDEADGWFRKITAIDPENDESYVELATIYWDYFKYDRGLAVLAERRAKAGAKFTFGREVASLFELSDSVEVAVPEYISAICAPDGPEPADQGAYDENDGPDGEQARQSEDDEAALVRGRSRAVKRGYSHYSNRYERQESPEIGECRARLVTLYRRSRVRPVIDSSFERMMAENSANMKLFVEYAKILMEYGHNEKAASLLSKAFAGASRSHELIGLAGLFERIKRPAEARDCYKKAMEADPRNYSVYSDAISFFRNNGFSQELSAALGLRAASFPEDVYYSEEYIRFLMNEKTSAKSPAAAFDEAKKVCERMISRFPERLQYRIMMSDIVMKNSGRDASIAYVDGLISNCKALKIGPDDVMRLRETKARLLAAAGRPDEMLAIYAGLIYENPLETSFGTAVADVAVRRGWRPKTDAFMEGLDEARMKAVNKYLMKARYYARLADHDRAADSFRRALAENPGNHNATIEFFNMLRQGRRFAEAAKLIPAIIKYVSVVRVYNEFELRLNAAAVHFELGESAAADALIDEYLGARLDEWKKSSNSGYCSFYVEGNRRYAVLLTSRAMHDEATRRLEDARKHLEADTRNNNRYAITDIIFLMAESRERAGDLEGALALVVDDLITPQLSSGQSFSFPDAYAKKAISLMRSLGRHEESLKFYAEKAASGDAAAADYKKLLLLIYKADNDWKRYVKYAISSRDPYAVNASISHFGQSRVNDELRELLNIRIAFLADERQRSNLAADLIRLGVAEAARGNDRLAGAYFGMALESSPGTQTLRNIGDSLSSAGQGAMASTYYKRLLAKFSDRSYYFNAAEVASSMAAHGSAADAIAVCDRLLEKYPDDLRIKSSCAPVYSSCNDRGRAAALFAEVASDSPGVADMESAIVALSGLVPHERYLETIEKVIKARVKGEKASDFNFLFVKRAEAMLDGHEGPLSSVAVSLASSYRDLGTDADARVSFYGALLAAMKSCEKKATDYPEAYSAVVKIASDSLNFGQKAPATLSMSQVQSEASAVISAAPEGARFGDTIGPFVRSLREKYGSTGRNSFMEIARAKLSYSTREDELFAFYRENFDTSLAPVISSARELAESGDHALSLCFARFAESLDNKCEVAKLATLIALSGLGRTTEAVALAGVIRPETFAEVTVDESSEYLDGGAVYYDTETARVKYLSCAASLGLSNIAGLSAALVKDIRESHSYDHGYASTANYHQALSIYFRNCPGPFREAEFLQAFEDIYSRVGYHGPSRDPDQISRLASLYCELAPDAASGEGFGAAKKPAGKAPAPKKGEKPEAEKAVRLSAARYYLAVRLALSKGDFGRAEKSLSAAMTTFENDPRIIGLVMENAHLLSDLGLVKKASSVLSCLTPAMAGEYEEDYLIEAARRSLDRPPDGVPPGAEGDSNPANGETRQEENGEGGEQ